MSEMVERVAKAMCEQSYSKSEEMLPWYWTSETGDERDEWRAMARAAIEAMREPSKAMVTHMNEKHPDLRFRRLWEEFWNALIDEALK